MVYDVVIIGAGIAGYSAALMLNVYGIKNIVIISKRGGHILNTPMLYNYPGINEFMTGKEFYDRIDKQVSDCKIGVIEKFVTSISRASSGDFIIDIDAVEIRTKIILIATGLVCQKPFIPDFDNYKQSIHSCIACSNLDLNEYIDKKIVIIGGADNALETALQLKSNQITIISRSDIKATPTLINQIDKINYDYNNNIKIITRKEIIKLHGESIISGNKLVGVTTNDGIYYECDIIIYAIGHKPSINFAKNLGIETDEKGYVKIKNGTETNIKNIFACGTVSNDRYTTTSATVGFGAMAATDIYNRINL
jgi:thioredoxin reductase (NADPH)